MTSIQKVKQGSPARSANVSATKRIELGAQGSAVVSLQNLLKELGLYGGNPDGKFGKMTAAAVRAFQRAHGLAVDGWAGPKTIMRMKAALASHPNATSDKLVSGAKGEAVKGLQQKLKALGLYSGVIGGNLGVATEGAIKAFQRIKGLKVDGWAGPKTLRALGIASAAPSAAAEPTPVAPSTSSPVGDVAQSGAPANIQAAIDFGLSHLGAPYVGGASPFRFGTPGDGSTHQMQGQKAYLSPRGVIGFDCSGLMVTMLKKAGIDISRVGSSRAMKSSLPNVPKSQIQPGDLIVKNGHVAMYIGNGQMIESVPGGVKVSEASRYLNKSEYSVHRPS
jgi:peptidoglycan hydrolase-like protein with peptidoglycan-binding domain